MAGSRRLSQLKGSITARAVFPGRPWVVGLSGGADSAALALVAAEGLERCVHVHHGFEASDQLAEAATAIAEKLGVALSIEKVEVPKGPSVENMARQVRYGAFATMVGDSEPLLLGHTQDDQAETVLLDLIRGAGTAGLAGMPYHRAPNIYRPFLEVSRTETREVAALSGLPFFDDPTNLDTTFRRNRVRETLIPLIEEMNPGVVAGLARTASHIRSDAELLDSMSVVEPVRLDGGLAVAASQLELLHPSLRARAVRNLLADLRGGGTTAKELERIDSVISGGAEATELEGGVRVERRAALVLFMSADNDENLR